MVRLIARAGIAFVVVYFAWHVGPVYVAHRQFKAEVAETTRAGTGNGGPVGCGASWGSARCGRISISSSRTRNSSSCFRRSRIRGHSASTPGLWPSPPNRGTTWTPETRAANHGGWRADSGARDRTVAAYADFRCARGKGGRADLGGAGRWRGQRGAGKTTGEGPGSSGRNPRQKRVWSGTCAS